MRKLFALILLFSLAYAAVLEVPAVTNTGKGVKVKLECEVIPGRGRVLVATEPFVGISTQDSERKAVKAVENLFGLDLENKDVIFIFHSNSSSIDGGSAGVAMAICLLSELWNKTPNQGVSVTGAIDEQGNVLPVGGILAKASAMRDKSVFLIPKGQGIVYKYVKRYYSPSPGIYVEEVVPVKVNVSEYAKAMWNLTVVEISSLNEAVEWFFNANVSGKEGIAISSLPNFTTPLPRVLELARFEIKRAENAIKGNDTSAKELLSRALSVPDQFPYTKANYAFLAAVTASSGYSGDITPVAKKLEEEFKNTPTSDPYWRAEAELRLSWALFNTKNLAARREWLMIAAKMFALERTGNKSIDMNFVKELANRKIVEAKQVVELAKASGADVSNSEESLKMAVKSFDEGLYFAALYNALDAIAWAKANLGASFNLTKPYKHEFPEAYRRHAIYLLYAGESRGDRVGAYYSAIRAQLREGIFDSAPSGSFNFSIPLPDWRDLAIAALLAYIIWIHFKGRKSGLVELSEKELLVLAEVKAEAVKKLREKFEKGEISQDSYERLLKELGE